MGNNCEDKIKYGCPSVLFAKCVKTEINPPAFSPLTGSTCHDVEEVEQDFYTLIGGIKLEIDLTAITATCGTLPTIKNVKTLIQYFVNRDCAQQLQIDTLITQNLTQANQIANLQANVCP